MKYSIQNYAKALAEAVVSKKYEAAIAKNFVAFVVKNGDGAYLSKILEETERMLRRDGGPRKVVITSARPLGKSLKPLAKEIAKSDDDVEEAIDSSLIAGVKILVNDEMQFDGSLSAKLEKMFAR